MINSADILVIGGGMAGVCAALSAAETGKNVIVLERSSFIGGNATRSNVGTICGAYYRSVAGNIIPAGNAFSRDFVNAILKEHRLKTPVNYHNGLFIVPYDWSVLLKFLKDKIAGRDNIKTFCNAEVNKVITQDKKIVSVIAKINDENVRFSTRSVIDCSGNGVISLLADIENIFSDCYQAAAQVFRLTGVKPTTEFSLNMALKKNMAKLVSEMKWPHCFRAISVVPGSLRNQKVDLKLPLPEKITDNGDDDRMLHKKANAYVQELFPFLKSDIESLSESSLEKIFEEPGIRVRQRSKGLEVLTEEMVLNCTKPENGVAAGVWPIEHWDNSGKVEMNWFEPEDHYLVPSGCLESGELENLYFAGKNISATERAIASARVIGTCIQTGYAAGKLAACENKKAQKRAIEVLHQELKEGSREYI